MKEGDDWRATGVVCPECNDGYVLRRERSIGAGREVEKYVCDTCRKDIELVVIDRLLADQ